MSSYKSMMNCKACEKTQYILQGGDKVEKLTHRNPGRAPRVLDPTSASGRGISGAVKGGSDDCSDQRNSEVGSLPSYPG